MNDMTILCVTECAFPDPREPQIRLLGDMIEVAKLLDACVVFCEDSDPGAVRLDRRPTDHIKVVHHKSAGYIESILDNAVAACTTKYILRLDDDERCSPAMVQWLLDRRYREADNWSFPRTNLWKVNPYRAEKAYITTPPLWPDIQTRLSVKEKSGGRTRIHQASPFGAGRIAPVCIEHHKFLIYSQAERRAGAARYESLQQGAGTGHFEVFSVPEVLGELELKVLGDGTVA